MLFIGKYLEKLGQLSVDKSSLIGGGINSNFMIVTDDFIVKDRDSHAVFKGFSRKISVEILS